MQDNNVRVTSALVRARSGGDAFRGDHEPILDAALFAAVQERLSTQAVARRCRIRGTPALLTGRLFYEQGRRMTPTHTNKKGVRYRYYVSQATMRIGRVRARVGGRGSTAVVDAIHHHLQADDAEPKPICETCP
jgi:hypothetical protein